jgi:AAA family ATPase
MARLKILQVMLRMTPHNITTKELQTIASQTHGYVGGDLAGLIREAGALAIKHVITFEEHQYQSSSSRTSPPQDTLTYADFLHATRN